MTKTCSKCDQDKPLTEYSRDAKSKDGYVARCKACVAAYRQTYDKRVAAERVEPAPTDTKTCTKCGVEKPYTEYHRKASSKDGHRTRCKTCGSASQKAWREANKDRVAAHKKTYYEANLERTLARQKAYHAERWATDPEYRAQCKARSTRYYRLLTSAKQETYTREDIFERDGWTCWICDEPVDREVEYPHSGYPSIDHITPVSLGGDDTPSNVRLAHLGCNSARGARVA